MTDSIGGSFFLGCFGSFRSFFSMKTKRATISDSVSRVRISSHMYSVEKCPLTTGLPLPASMPLPLPLLNGMKCVASPFSSVVIHASLRSSAKWTSAPDLNRKMRVSGLRSSRYCRIASV